MLNLCVIVLLFDLLIGDPPDRFHPTAWIGGLAAFLGRLLYVKQGLRARLAGAALVILVCAAAALPAWLAQHLLFKFLPSFAAEIVVCALASLALGVRSLASHAGQVLRALLSGKTDDARKDLSKIVGRDTHNLSRREICRATVESLAESLGDSVLAPLFFFFLLGLPGIFLYRAANTMDSMIGHKDETHLDFGWAAARFDDLLNCAPARLLAIPSVVMASLIFKLQTIKTISTAMEEHSISASPSAGWYEAAFAGALDVELGGVNHYDGVPSGGSLFNAGAKKCRPRNIVSATKLLFGAAFSAALILDVAYCVVKIMP